MIVGSLEEEFTIEKEIDINLVNRRVTKFYADLKRAAPVRTGHFRSEWQMDRRDKLTWQIENNASYARDLWFGRRRVAGGRFVGSNQWPEGGEPMLAKFRYDLEHK